MAACSRSQAALSPAGGVDGSCDEWFHGFPPPVEVNALSTSDLQQPGPAPGRFPQVRSLGHRLQEDGLQDVFGVVIVRRMGETDGKHGLGVPTKQRRGHRRVAIVR